LAAKNFIATNTQWKSWYTARTLCFNKSFIRKCTDKTRIPNLGVWCKSDPIGLPESDKTCNSDLRVVRNPTPPERLPFSATRDTELASRQ